MRNSLKIVVGFIGILALSCTLNLSYGVSPPKDLSPKISVYDSFSAVVLSTVTTVAQSPVKIVKAEARYNSETKVYTVFSPAFAPAIIQGRIYVPPAWHRQARLKNYNIQNFSARKTLYTLSKRQCLSVLKC